MTLANKYNFTTFFLLITLSEGCLIKVRPVGHDCYCFDRPK
jgi:hypothetical protein